MYMDTDILGSIKSRNPRQRPLVVALLTFFNAQNSCYTYNYAWREPRLIRLSLVDAMKNVSSSCSQPEFAVIEIRSTQVLTVSSPVLYH